MKRSLLSAAASLAMVIGVTGITVPSIADAAPRRIEVTAKRFEYQPNQITLKKGEPVVLVLKSLDVPHGIRFKDLNLDAKAGRSQTSEIPFTPEKAGKFVGHCSVFCGAGHGGMTLTLTVTE